MTLIPKSDVTIILLIKSNYHNSLYLRFWRGFSLRNRISQMIEYVLVSTDSSSRWNIHRVMWDLRGRERCELLLEKRWVFRLWQEDVEKLTAQRSSHHREAGRQRSWAGLRDDQHHLRVGTAAADWQWCDRGLVHLVQRKPKWTPDESPAGGTVSKKESCFVSCLLNKKGLFVKLKPRGLDLRY